MLLICHVRTYLHCLRPKRSVYQLYNMVVCATGCNPISYLGYGCYCGFLGSGSPVDPIDKLINTINLFVVRQTMEIHIVLLCSFRTIFSCCKMHDWCYDRADCPMFLEYFTPYAWTCYNKKPLCCKYII